MTCECDENNKNEFEVRCYDECPENNHTIENGKDICVGPVPEYYYKDDDDMYRKCFDTCQKCSQPWNVTNNNCEKCKDNYKFLNDSLAEPNNCYKQCHFYYFFNISNFNQYECTETESCPKNFKNLILPKKRCIDDCKKDDSGEYTYEYNNNCSSECPENTKLIEEEKLCLDICYPEQSEHNNLSYNVCPNGTHELITTTNPIITTTNQNIATNKPTITSTNPIITTTNQNIPSTNQNIPTTNPIIHSITQNIPYTNPIFSDTNTIIQTTFLILRLQPQIFLLQRQIFLLLILVFQ